MKLIQELYQLSEAAKETGTEVKDLFKIAKDEGKLATFQKKKLFDARPAIDGEEITITAPGKVKSTLHGKDGLWVVRDHENINVVDCFNARNFKKKFIELRANQKPDAEGFIAYREAGEYEAIKYKGNTFTFKNVLDDTQRVKTGDWIVRSIDLGLYFVVKTSDFNGAFQQS